jgi:hypothetical protein
MLMVTFFDSPCLTLVAVAGRLSWKLFSGLLSLPSAPRLLVARAPGPPTSVLLQHDERQDDPQCKLLRVVLKRIDFTLRGT